MPRSAASSRRSKTFAWVHPDEVRLDSKRDVVHWPVVHVYSGPRDEHGFRKIRDICCCMKPVYKKTDQEHCKGCLVDASTSAVKYLGKFRKHILQSNCWKKYSALWFPAGKRVWIQLGEGGPLIRLYKVCILLCFLALFSGADLDLQTLNSDFACSRQWVTRVMMSWCWTTRSCSRQT